MFSFVSKPKNKSFFIDFFVIIMQSYSQGQKNVAEQVVFVLDIVLTGRKLSDILTHTALTYNSLSHFVFAYFCSI